MKYLSAFLGLVLLSLPVQAQAQDSYNIQPGDVLRIEVLEDPSLNRDALVLPDGRVSLPLAGLIQAGGRSIDSVQADIAGRLAPNFAAAPSVFVGIAQLSQDAALGAGGLAGADTISIFLMGEATSPGKIEVEPGSTILQALAQAGGVTNFAATKRLQLRRAGKVYQMFYM